MTNIIEIRNLTLKYNNKLIFDKLSLDIIKGNFVSILGGNGSGKSSLANILYGLVPYLGSAKIEGITITENNIEKIRNKINVIFEVSNDSFIFDMVIDEIKNNTKDDYAYVVKKLELSNLLYKKISSLSCGEKQLVLIAAALVNKPQVLILDNALNMLDNKNKNNVMQLLNKYNKDGMTIVNITQNSEDILYGNQVIIFDKGNIILNESVRKSLEQEKVFLNSHVNLPFMAELCIKLKYYNLISKLELNKVRLVNMIWK